MLGCTTMVERRLTVAIRLAVRVAAALILLAVLQPAAPALAQESGEIPVGDRSILISLADRRLYVVEQGERVRSFPVAIGRPGVEIPVGDSSILRKRRDPTWRPTANQRRANPSLPSSVPPGPDNPLGRYALDLGWAAIAIHGTNEPDSIGRRASGGCFRMMPADIESLYGLAAVGMPVRVVRDPAGGQQAASREIGSREVGSRQQVRPVPGAVKASPPPLSTPPVPAPRLAAPLPVFLPALRPAVVAVEPPPPVVPDPRCPSATAPLRRLICGTPELAALDGKVRGTQKRFLDGLADRAAAAYALSVDEQRFEDRISALCWVRKGTEGDPAVAAAARGCLSTALSGRLEDVTRRVAEMRSKPAFMAARP